ncbi:MAG: hypothetical protein WAO61_09345 [Solirubrobacterales bacterium]
MAHPRSQLHPAPRASRSACRLAVCAATLAAVLALPTSATALTFGADLNRPANMTTDCTTVAPPLWPISTGASTCTWSTTAATLSPLTESSVVPAGNGLVTQVRVKVGPTTGPMQIVVMRALRHPNAAPDAGAACCKSVATSAVFTPQANAITTIDTQFAVRNDKAPDPASGVYNFDQLALSVLAAGVPIPAHSTGNYSGLADSNVVFYPAWQSVGQERADGGGMGGYVVLMNADWRETQGPAPDAPMTRLVSLARPKALVRRGSALLDLVCNQALPCDGRVELANAQPGTIAASRKRTVSYGKRSFKISAGKTKRVKVRLSARGRRLLRGRKRAKVWVNFSLTGASARVRPARLTLRR